MGMILSVVGKKKSVHKTVRNRRVARQVFFEKFEYKVLVEGKVITVPENGIVRMY